MPSPHGPVPERWRIFFQRTAVARCDSENLRANKADKHYVQTIEHVLHNVEDHENRLGSSR